MTRRWGYLNGLVDFTKYQKKISLNWLVGLMFAVLFGILLFGLSPRDFNFSKNVTWITDQPGIRFSKYGIAYTDSFIATGKEGGSGTDGFSIEIALKPLSDHEEGFNFPDGHLKIPHLWPGQNTPATE